MSDELDVSNTIIVKAQKHGMSLEEAEKLAEELAEEEAESVEGQLKTWFKKNFKAFLIWLTAVCAVFGAGSLAYLKDVFQ